MKFVIRDDDTSYFTSKEDLEKAYGFIENGQVSLSVVPYAVPHHEKGVRPYGEGIPYGYYPVGDNAELVAYLNNNKDKYDLMLHGYSHEYQMVDGEWQPEMIWKDEERIAKEMKEGKEYLEKVFQREFTVFIAPNNAVNAKTLRSVEALGMDYGGIIKHRDRDWSPRYAMNYVHRYWIRLRTGMLMPGVLNYGRHKEMVSYGLDDFETLMKEYELCKKMKAPFAIYTHYWVLNKDPMLKQRLRDLYHFMMCEGAELVSMSSCFKEARK